jgi:hypothetical protein
MRNHPKVKTLAFTWTKKDADKLGYRRQSEITVFVIGQPTIWTTATKAQMASNVTRVRRVSALRASTAPAARTSRCAKLF